MNHLKWMGHSATIFDIQKSLKNDEKSCDVLLVGKEKSVRAHRFVLSSSSDLFRDLLAETPVGQEATIIIPDMKGALLDSVLNFIYLGETSLSSSTLTDFLESISILGIKSAISFECANSSMNGKISSKVLTEITEIEDDLVEAETEQESMDKVEQEQEQTIEPGTERELEFLQVYNEPQKITYSFEHNYDNSSSGNAFILAETSGTLTLTDNTKSEQDIKLDTSDKEKYEADCYEDEDEEADSSQLTEEQMMEEVEYSEAKISVNNCLQEQFDSSADSATALADIKEAANDSSEEYKSLNFCDFQARRNENLERAAAAVVDQGMSLQKAALRYSISKTVLWRRVKKHPLYMKTQRENPIIATACERLKTGDSLKSISQALDIPMSTLHRHKVRLAQEGRLPHYITFKKRGPLSKEVLKEKLSKALKACIDNGMSQNYAANLFEVPKSTLWRHLQKRLAAGEIIADVKEEVILS